MEGRGEKKGGVPEGGERREGRGERGRGDGGREGGGGRGGEGKESQEETPNSHYSLDYLTSDGDPYSCCGESSDECGSLTLLQRTILLHRQTENCTYSKAP